MQHLLQKFATFREAASFAREIAKLHKAEPAVQRYDDRWAVFSPAVISELSVSEVIDRTHEIALQEKEEQIERLRSEFSNAESELARVLEEKDEFRRRVIAHETKSSEAVGKTISRSNSSSLVSPVLCEACRRREAFCICGR